MSSDALPNECRVSAAALPHGNLIAGLPPPACVAVTDKVARPHYNSVAACEYLDSAADLAHKAAAVASLLRERCHRVVYTGAGISTASGVPDYASRAGASVAPHKSAARSQGRARPPAPTVNRLESQPTAAHHALASLHQAGFIQHWYAGLMTSSLFDRVADDEHG